MDLRQHARNRIRGFLQAYGTAGLKKRLWDSEFSGGRWNCLEATSGDCIYPFVERLAAHGSILDLGCGSGTMGHELDPYSYRLYVGVDISGVAVERARRRSEENRRGHQNRFVQCDILDYTPDRLFNVILFRDSIYYIPHRRIVDVLNRYAKSLEETGVFIVRMANGRSKYQQIIDSIERSFELVAKQVFASPEAVVMVFRPAPRT